MADKCLICNCEKLKHKQAQFNDYIKHVLCDDNDIDTDILACENCGFEYTSHRYSQKELEKIYKNYRSEEYQKERQKFDTWYSKQINEIIGRNQTEIKNRVNNLIKILDTNVINWKSDFKNVLDYGGDKGQFIPKEIPNKYVFEVSGAKPLDNINKINNLNSDIKWDFIMCCHVLEHVTNPNEILEKISSVSNSNTYLYIEVPNELIKTSLMSKLTYIFNPYFNIKDIIRQFIKMKNAKGWLVSEHINFFTEKSIELLVEKYGYKIINTSTQKLDCAWCKSDVISVLAKKI